jgi:hypothetical protein
MILYFFGPGRLAPCRMPACFDADIRPSFLPGYVVGFAFGGGEFSSPVFLSVGIFAPWVCFIAFNWGEAVKLPPTLPPMTWKLDESAGVTQY